MIKFIAGIGVGIGLCVSLFFSGSFRYELGNLILWERELKSVEYRFSVGWKENPRPGYYPNYWEFSRDGFGCVIVVDSPEKAKELAKKMVEFSYQEMTK
jgi:hypothetical protein